MAAQASAPEPGRESQRPARQASLKHGYYSAEAKPPVRRPDAVDEETDDAILAEVTRREPLVLGPQPLGARSSASPCFVRERVFDVARRQSVRTDRQVPERSRPPR
jgi:hypothetical protein